METVPRGDGNEEANLPPVKARRGTLGVALAVAVTAGAIGAPAVSASTTSASDHTAISAFVWSGPGGLFYDEWRLAADPGAPISERVIVEPRVAVVERPERKPTRTTARERKPERKPQRSAQVAAKPKARLTQSSSDVRQVIRYLRRAIGADFKIGTEGQKIGRRTYFDCSGLVYRAYQQAGLVSRVGGARRGATSFYNWFKSRGLVSRGNPKPGDLVVYQHRGERVIPHMGIYIGHGRVISALINPWGVRSHSLNGIGIPFKAFLHVRNGR